LSPPGLQNGHALNWFALGIYGVYFGRQRAISEFCSALSLFYQKQKQKKTAEQLSLHLTDLFFI